MNEYYFRINIEFDWVNVCPNLNVFQVTSVQKARQNLGHGKYVRVEQKEHLYSYSFFDSNGNLFPVFKKNWTLNRIEESRELRDRFTFYLHISDPANVERKIKCYIYESNWTCYGSRFIYVVCSSINYLLCLADTCNSWSDKQAQEIYKNPLMIYLIQDSICMSLLSNEGL